MRSYRPAPLDDRLLRPTAATSLARRPFWRLGVLIVVLHLVGVTWARGLEWEGVAPNLALLGAVATGMLGGPTRGAAAGLCAGYLTYLSAMWHPGSHLMSHLVAGALAGVMGERLGTAHPLAPPLVAVAATLASDLVFLLLSPTDAAPTFWARHAFWASLWHAALIWPVWALARRVVGGKAGATLDWKGRD